MQEHSDRAAQATSQYELRYPNGDTFIDPKRAHTAAGDPGYTRRIKGCAQCEAKTLAEEAQQAQEVLVDKSRESY